jgi:predicted nucleic acid-binding protein
MITIIDANAALELALGKPKKDKVAEILQASNWIAAPSLYLYEIANVMWKYYRSGSLDEQAIKNMITDCGDLVNEYIPASALFKEAAVLACKINHSAYDTAYLTACQLKDAGLLSFDMRLVAAAKKLGITVY